jgi:hypothetical protein
MKTLTTILNWLLFNYGWFVSLLIQGFIASHVFFLSKKLSNINFTLIVLENFITYNDEF